MDYDFTINPAVSEAQRRYLNATKGHDWVKEHSFDNRGELPEKKSDDLRKSKKPGKKQKKITSNRTRGRVRSRSGRKKQVSGPLPAMLGPNRIDPTQTGTLRRRMLDWVRGRFRALAGDIIKFVELDDSLELGTTHNAFCPTGKDGGQDNSCGSDFSKEVRRPTGGRAWAKGLSEDERLAVEDWIDYPTDIRKHFKEGSINDNDRALISALERAPIVRGQVYRGLTFTDSQKGDFLSGMREGSEWTDVAPHSMTRSGGMAANYSVSGMNEFSHTTGVVLVVGSRSGRSIEGVFQNQKEVVGMPNTPYLIKKIEHGVKFGRQSITVIHMDEVGKANNQAAHNQMRSERGHFGPAGDEGLERKDMPQVVVDDHDEMIEWIKDRGVTADREEVETDSLTPLQRDFNQSKVDERPFRADKPIIISADDRILDGTHNWMRARRTMAGGIGELSAIRIGLGWEDALELLHKFPRSFKQPLSSVDPELNFNCSHHWDEWGGYWRDDASLQEVPMGMVDNAFCPTEKGGGRDNSCSVSQAQKNGAIQALSKLPKAGAPASGDPRALPGEVYRRQPLVKVETGKELDASIDKVMSRKSPKRREVDLKDLIATQSSVRERSVKHMIGEANQPQSPMMHELPIVVQRDGKQYLKDGHHRIAALHLLGVKTTEVQLYSDGKARRVSNAFCPTGAEGGVDPSCSSHEALKTPTSVATKKIVKDISNRQSSLTELNIEGRRIIAGYGGTKEVNNEVRGDFSTERSKKYARALDSTFEQVSSVGQSMLLYRGVTGGKIFDAIQRGNLKVGDEEVEHGYSSTSYDKSKGVSYAYRGHFDTKENEKAGFKAVMLKVTTAPGIKALDVDKWSSMTKDHELLLSRGVSYKVTKIEHSSNHFEPTVVHVQARNTAAKPIPSAAEPKPGEPQMPGWLRSVLGNSSQTYETLNVFCPAGAGGGVDSSCGKAEKAAASFVHRWSWKGVGSSPTIAAEEVLRQSRPSSPVTLYRFQRVDHDPAKAQMGTKVPLQAWSKSRDKVQGIADAMNESGEEGQYHVLTKTFHPSEIYADFSKLPEGVKSHLKVMGGHSEMDEVLVRHYHTTNVFCPTGTGGGVDASCGKGTGGLARSTLTRLSKLADKLPGVAWARGKIVALKRGLVDRYGVKQAGAIIAAANVMAWAETPLIFATTGVPWVPGLSLMNMVPGIILAELAHHLPGKQVLANSPFIVLTKDEIQIQAQTLLDQIKRTWRESRNVHNEGEPITNAPNYFAEHSSPAKLEMFKQWLKTQIESSIIGKTEQQLWEMYAKEGYKKGAGRAFDQVRMSKLKQKHPEYFSPEHQNQVKDFYAGTKDEFLRDSFAQPVGVERIKLLASRSFDDLKNVTHDMGTRMSRTLMDGLTQGKSPHDVARDLVGDVEISRARAETIARSEIVRAHAEGQLDSFDKLGVSHIGVAVEWSTTGDNKVCEKCQPLEGIVLKVSEAHGTIPRHPNCRCAYLPANVDEDDPSQKTTKKLVTEAIRESKEEGGDSDKWGPAKPISADRPKSIFNESMGGFNDNPYLDELIEDSGVEWLREDPLYNAFCPTGKGGGPDNSCSPNELSEEQVQAIVRQSPNLRDNPKFDDDRQTALGNPTGGWQRYVERFGITGGFVKGEADVSKLGQEIDRGYLRLSGGVEKAAVAEKVSSGRLNTVIITREPGRGLLVVDGNHSLKAAIERGEKRIKIIVAKSASSLIDNAFCPTGKGNGQDNTCGSHSSQRMTAEHLESRNRALAKIAAAPRPSKLAVENARLELEAAKRGEGRAGGESRGGGSAERRRQRQNLFKEWGGEERGYVVCPWTGIKMHWSNDPKENPRGHPVFERGKVFVKCQGGGYQLPNLIPESFTANRARNDKRLRKENSRGC